jgi:hypothetical protein
MQGGPGETGLAPLPGFCVYCRRRKNGGSFRCQNILAALFHPLLSKEGEKELNFVRFLSNEDEEASSPIREKETRQRE